MVPDQIGSLIAVHMCVSGQVGVRYLEPQSSHQEPLTAC